MSLNDRDALAVLHAAIDPDDENGLIGRFYTRWFSFDVSPRDLFPPDMAGQRAAFAHALNWVYGELVAQRAEEPVAFLAQLGRDHRKYGVLPEHYETMRQALHATLPELRRDLVDAGFSSCSLDIQQSGPQLDQGQQQQQSAPQSFERHERRERPPERRTVQIPRTNTDSSIPHRALDLRV